MNPAIFFIQKWERELDAKESGRRRGKMGEVPNRMEDRKDEKPRKCTRSHRPAACC